MKKQTGVSFSGFAVMLLPVALFPFFDRLAFPHPLRESCMRLCGTVRGDVLLKGFWLNIGDCISICPISFCHVGACIFWALGALHFLFCFLSVFFFPFFHLLLLIFFPLCSPFSLPSLHFSSLFLCFSSKPGKAVQLAGRQVWSSRFRWVLLFTLLLFSVNFFSSVSSTLVGLYTKAYTQAFSFRNRCFNFLYPFACSSGGGFAGGFPHFSEDRKVITAFLVFCLFFIKETRSTNFSTISSLLYFFR